MKDGIKDMRDALTPEEVLPNMMVVEIDSPEQYVEEKGLDVAGQINHLIKEETESIGDYNSALRCFLDLLSDKDIEKLKQMIADKKANVTILQEMATTYDEIEIDKAAAPSLKKLLKKTK